MPEWRATDTSPLPRCDGNVSDLNQMALKSWILMIGDVNVLLLLKGFKLAAGTGISVLPPSACVTIGWFNAPVLQFHSIHTDNWK